MATSDPPRLTFTCALVNGVRRLARVVRHATTPFGPTAASEGAVRSYCKQSWMPLFRLHATILTIYILRSIYLVVFSGCSCAQLTSRSEP